MTTADEREALHREMAMRLFLRYSLHTQHLTVEQTVEYERLKEEGPTFQRAWDYNTRMAAENARREAEVFVEAYYGGEVPVVVHFGQLGMVACGIPWGVGETRPDWLEVTCEGCLRLKAPDDD